MCICCVDMNIPESRWRDADHKKQFLELTDWWHNLPKFETTAPTAAPPANDKAPAAQPKGLEAEPETKNDAATREEVPVEAPTPDELTANDCASNGGAEVIPDNNVTVEESAPSAVASSSDVPPCTPAAAADAQAATTQLKAILGVSSSQEEHPAPKDGDVPAAHESVAQASETSAAEVVAAAEAAASEATAAEVAVAAATSEETDLVRRRQTPPAVLMRRNSEGACSVSSTASIGSGESSGAPSTLGCSESFASDSVRDDSARCEGGEADGEGEGAAPHGSPVRVGRNDSIRTSCTWASDDSDEEGLPALPSAWAAGPPLTIVRLADPKAANASGARAAEASPPLKGVAGAWPRGASFGKAAAASPRAHSKPAKATGKPSGGAAAKSRFSLLQVEGGSDDE